MIAEPVPYLAERLRQKWKHARINIVAKAICHPDDIVDGQATMKMLPQEQLAELPPWASGLASLTDRNALSPGYWASARGQQCVARYGVTYDTLASHVQVVNVPAVTPGQLLGETGWTRFDLVKIDAEGYDSRIIQAIDFTQFWIEELCYEMAYLPPDEAAQVKGLLEGVGFSVRQHTPQDCLAFRESK